MISQWKKLKIFLLYFLLIAGGFWHLFDLFQKLMISLASPLLIALAGWLILENFLLIKSEPAQSSYTSKKIFIFLGWIFLVYFLTMFIEGLGVKTGKIFGHYNYGTVLFPFLWNVPLAIGFAWLSMLLSSIPLAQWICRYFQWKNRILFIIIAALWMTLFDFFMEPAALKLHYWNWLDGKIPLQNYLAWFVISFLLIGLGQLFSLFSQKLSSVGIHAYFAQLLYFLLVNLK